MTQVRAALAKIEAAAVAPMLVTMITSESAAVGVLSGAEEAAAEAEAEAEQARFIEQPGVWTMLPSAWMRWLILSAATLARGEWGAVVVLVEGQCRVERSIKERRYTHPHTMTQQLKNALGDTIPVTSIKCRRDIGVLE